MFNSYTINSNDRFAENLYPAIVKEVAALHHALMETRELYKIDIIISFLKYHSVRSEWLKANKEATNMLTSGSLAISHLESLFNSSRNNLPFTDGLEAYIRLKFSNEAGLVNAGEKLHSS